MHLCPWYRAQPGPIHLDKEHKHNIESAIVVQVKEKQEEQLVECNMWQLEPITIDLWGTWDTEGVGV